MAEVSHEPSMEEILSSIKKIISEDSDKSLSAPRRARADTIPTAPLRAESDDVLELNDRIEPQMAPERPSSVVADQDAAPLISEGAAAASRDAFASLASVPVRAEPAPSTMGGQSVDDLVRDMLRPMLKDWLDTNLPAIVEGVVAKEVARISGR